MTVTRSSSGRLPNTRYVTVRGAIASVGGAAIGGATGGALAVALGVGVTVVTVSGGRVADGDGVGAAGGADVVAAGWGVVSGGAGPPAVQTWSPPAGGW